MTSLPSAPADEGSIAEMMRLLFALGRAPWKWSFNFAQPHCHRAEFSSRPQRPQRDTASSEIRIFSSLDLLSTIAQ